MLNCLKHIESEFDRQQLRYLELIDIFSVAGVHKRLRELRQAQDSKEGGSILAAKRRFLEPEDEWKCPVPVKKPDKALSKATTLNWLNIELSTLPVGKGQKFLSLHQKHVLTESVN